MPELTNQIALVTGASGGIGRSIAIELSRLGAKVCLVARRRDCLDELAATLPSPSAVLPCDITDDVSLRRLVEDAQRHFGAVDILVHCAAAYYQGPFETSPVEEFDLQYRANLRAPYLLTQLLLPQIRQRRGQIVFINSTQGTSTRPGVTQYAATKHGLRALADSLRQELAGTGIRVVSVYPGQTATPMQQRRYQIESKNYEPDKLIQPQDIATIVAQALCLPRSAEVTDLHVRPAL